MYFLKYKYGKLNPIDFNLLQRSNHQNLMALD
jgi:hypothetical protein